ncbi:PilZ domain-containing protein [Candidatus Nitrospira bockiana]
MEQRRSPRFAIQLPISFSGNQTIGSGLVSELSQGGCSVTSEDRVQGGAALVLHIQLPDQEAPLKADASVRWTNGMTFGCEFLRLPLKDKERLRHFIGALDRAAENRARKAS